MSLHYLAASRLWQGNYRTSYCLLIELRELEWRSILFKLLILHSLWRWNILPHPEEGERLQMLFLKELFPSQGERLQLLFLQELFPYTTFLMVMEMVLVAATLTMLTIPSSHHPTCRIGGEPPIEQRMRSSNDAWCMSKTSVAPKGQGSATFTIPTQQRRYRRPLELQSTLSPRTHRGGPIQLSIPTYNPSILET